MQALHVLRKAKIMNWLHMGWRSSFSFTYLDLSVCLPYAAGGFFVVFG